MRDLLKRLRREALWNPVVNPLLFFAAAYVFGISVNLTSNHVRSDSTLGKALLFGGPALIVLAILWPRLARLWFRKDVRPLATLGPARRHRWLVALASPGRGIETVESAIRYHYPALERVWLICSRGGETPSEEAALGLKHKLEVEGFFRADRITLKALPVSEFEDPERVRSEIERIYDQLPEDVEESDVVIDITGGHKTTTAGAFLAGLPPGRHLEIVSPIEVDREGKGIKPGDPIEIVIDYSMRRVRKR